MEKHHFSTLGLIDSGEMQKLENLKKAVSDGTYWVRAEDLAPKLIEYMLQSSIVPETLIGQPSSNLDAQGSCEIASPVERRGQRK